MKKTMDRLKQLLNKDITNFVIKYKLPLGIGLVAVLLTCIGFFVSYAFYQVTTPTPIVGVTTGKIADLEVRVMAEERDTNGNGLGKYALYPYIPRAGYQYNAAKSKCTNGSTFEYDAENFEVNVKATGHDICYVYFDSTAALDLTLNVWAENIDSNGEGTGEYTKLETTALPSVGYTLARSNCQNGSTVSYNAEENMFSVEASNKDVCDVYMDAMDVDIGLKILIQAKKGSSEYYEAKSIPNNVFYTLGADSACTGTSTLSITNQRVVIAATGKTSCVAYLNVSSGPILESMEASVDGVSVTIDLTNSNAGIVPQKYYFSSDNGVTYQEQTTASYTFENLKPLSEYTFKAYTKDASGNTSAILKVSATTDEENYVFNGVYPYSSTVQTVNIVKTGYYKLEVWGAQGGTVSSKVGGMGGYSEGVVHLNDGDILYVHTGGQGSAGGSSTLSGGGVNGGGGTYVASASGGGGGTDIRINTDTLYARVIVAGGGGGVGQDSCALATNGYGGGLTGGGSVTLSSSCGTQAGGGTQTAGGIGGLYSSTRGTSGTFGTGANATNGSYDGGGGGGGWYGGGAGASAGWSNSGGGGSGYVYTESTATNYPSGCLLDSSYYLANATTTSGNVAFLSPTGASETGHSGNGYAKVTYVGKKLS